MLTLVEAAILDVRFAEERRDTTMGRPARHPNRTLAIPIGVWREFEFVL